MTESPTNALPAFTEHRVQRDRGSLYVRDFPGSGPAFVVLHGFPDNSHIYDDLIPHLTAAGRRTIAIDFLGFGASDKPDGAHYSFGQQLGDLETVVEALGIDKIIPVGHDAGGPAAVNFALKHPERTAAVCLMNAFYGDAPGLRVPEFIELFSNKGLKALTRHFLASPQQFAWLLGFQRDQMQAGLTDAQKARYTDFLGPIIDNNFRQRPSAGPAFAQMTYQLTDEVAANTARLLDFRRSAVPLLLIWGKSDPYLHVSVAEYMRSQARDAALHVLEAGHWPQIDAAADVARILLASH
jgi:pimeloyl-ACP methyl ester carboxylesterase